MKTRFYLFLVALCTLNCSQNKSLTYDIVIVGGGTSGTAAAIQAGRSGADVLLLQEQDWLGGMLTAAGVSATDGNHKLPSGIWGSLEILCMHGMVVLRHCLQGGLAIPNSSRILVPKFSKI